MVHVANPYKWEEFLFHRGCSCDVTTSLKAGLIAGGRNSKEGRPTIFFKLVNPFGTIQTKNLAMTCQNRKKYTTTVCGNTQDAVYWINLTRAQDKGLRFWQTRSRAIIVYNFVPADCIYKVISHKGERTQFERLSTPRLAIAAAATAAATRHF